MKENIDFTIYFVQLIEKHPLLYDNTHCDYNCKRKVDEAWKQISIQTNESEYACKERWRNIRGSYLRCLREKSSGGGKFKKPYYLADHLQFVVPFLTITKIPSAVDQEFHDTLDSYICRSVSNPDTTIDQNTNEIPSVSQETTEYVNKYDVSKTKNKSKHEKRKRKRKVKLLTKYDQLTDIANKYYRAKLDKMQDEDQKNADSMFLQSLLPDFQCMSAIGKRQVKIAIMKIIAEELQSEKSNEK